METRCAGWPARAIPQNLRRPMTVFLFHLLSPLQRVASSEAPFAEYVPCRVLGKCRCLSRCLRTP